MRISTPADLAAEIKAARKHAHLTQDQLASLIGASRSWVKRLERGEPRVELELTLRAAHAVGLSINTGEQVGRPTVTTAPVGLTATPDSDRRIQLDRAWNRDEK